MAMTIPSPVASVSVGNSPASDESSIPPRTPVSPTDPQAMTLPDPAGNAQAQPSSPNAGSNNGAAGVKRKPSRRANTAERRATHNAVERQRRETLNGRFLDLAALLPNLSQIRRPSKSAIVNSSIAHIHASRRHRILASRELRLLKLESDALRRELNEWRDRAGLPRVEEPVRGEGFAMVLSGEVEILAAVTGEDDEDGGDMNYDGYGDDGEDYNAPIPVSAMDDSEDVMTAKAAAMLKNTNVFAPNTHGSGSSSPAEMNMAQMMSRSHSSHSQPVIAQVPPSVSYENPAMTSMYEPHMTPHFPGAPFISSQPHSAHPDHDKVAPWNAHMYNGFSQQQLHQMQAQRQLITPPGSAHGMPISQSPPMNGPSFDQALLADLKRQQLMALQQQQQQQHGNLQYPGEDDSSSVGSGPTMGRERSGSMSTNGYGSPPNGSSPRSYDLHAHARAHSEFAIPKRMGTGGLHINTGTVGPYDGMMRQQGISAPMSVGGNGGYPMTM